MRSKEDAQDYRYFPDPDLLPLIISQEMIRSIGLSMPELPEAKRRRYIEKGVTAYTAALLTASRERADFFEKAVSSGSAYDATANLVVGDLASLVNDTETSFSKSLVTPEDIAALQKRVADGTISGKIAKDLLRKKFEGQEEGSIDELIDKRGLKQISDSGEIEKLVDEVLQSNAKQVADFHAGKEKALQSLVGQVMKASKGKANPAQVNEVLRRKLRG
jgi:aspartyl-tRNA(Asn)/glutamyl-tRNA(Gln) amidotransferase subunit B